MKRNIGITIGLVLVVAATVGAVVVVSSSSKPDTAGKATSDSMAMADHSGGTVQSADNGDVVAATEVTIDNYAFKPAAITVKVGATVTWTNQDSVQHNVVTDDKSADAPDGPLLAKGESYKFTFKKAGTYHYHCAPHPYMKGTIEVTN